MGKIMLWYTLGSTAIAVLLGMFGFGIETVIVGSMIGAPGLHLLWLIARMRGIL